jgi:hypothetical protein
MPLIFTSFRSRKFRERNLFIDQKAKQGTEFTRIIDNQDNLIVMTQDQVISNKATLINTIQLD